MSWSNNALTVLVIMVAFVAVAGGTAAFVILVQMFGQGGFKLAEPSVRKARLQMLRPWLLVGAVFGLLMGIAIVLLSRSDQSPPTAPTEVITSPPTDVKSQPRDDGQ